MPPVDSEALASVIVILFGIITVLRRQRLAENTVRRHRAWKLKEIDVGESTFYYGVVGWVFVVGGVLTFLARSIA